MKTILDAVHDQRLFGPWFKDRDTWWGWFTFMRALFALPMSEGELALYRQCTGRSEPPISPASEVWLVCGRRAGKSFTLALIAVYLACFHDFRKHLSRGERGTILLIAVDRRQARTVLRYIKGLLTNVPLLSRMIERETTEGFDLNNGISIEVHTASFRSTRGYTIVGALLDELAFWRGEESTDPDTEIIAAIRPGMATIPGAVLLCASSPYARRGALWEAYRKHHGKDQDPVLVWQAATRIMNPTIQQSLVDKAMEDDPVAAAADYGAEFRSDIESYISREAIEACMALGVFERGPLPGVRYSAFVDPSGGSSDSFTLAVAHRDADSMVLDCMREVRPPFSPEAVVAEFATTLKTYGVTKVQGDKYAGEFPREQFRKHGITYEVSQKAKSDLYCDLLPLLNSRRAELLDHPKLIAQLVGFERRTARSGKDSIDHAPSAHDDIANACAGVLLAAHAAHKQRIRMGFLTPDYAPLYGRAPRSYEVHPITLKPLDQQERMHIRVVRLTEQEAPAVRGLVHGKLGS